MLDHVGQFDGLLQPLCRRRAPQDLYVKLVIRLWFRVHLLLSRHVLKWAPSSTALAGRSLLQKVGVSAANERTIGTFPYTFIVPDSASALPAWQGAEKLCKLWRQPGLVTLGAWRDALVLST
jgi:hypothetical protein